MVTSILWIGLLIFLSVQDIRHYRVPVPALITGSLYAAVVVLMRFVGGTETMTDTIWSIVKALVPGAFMLLFGGFTGKAGTGDGWVLLIMGGILPWNRVVAGFAVSLVLSAVWAVILLVVCKRKKDERLPYLPFLTMALLLTG